jgi:hypothetical protein
MSEGLTTRLRAGRPGFDSQRGRDLSIYRHIQTDSAAHSLLSDGISGALSLGVKRPDRETDHSPSLTAEVKNA